MTNFEAMAIGFAFRENALLAKGNRLARPNLFLGWCPGRPIHAMFYGRALPPVWPLVRGN